MAFSLKRLTRLGVLTLGLAAPTAQAQTAPAAPPALHLPANYLSRFGGTEVVAGLDSGVSFGVRSFPLPLEQDVRFTVVKRPQYWEYSLTTRVKDTTLAAGVFDSGPAAAAGVARLQVTHDPYKGFQYGGLIQGGGLSSRFTGGYALTVARDRVRVLNNVGVGFQGNVAAPFTQTEVGGGYGRAFGKVNVSFGTTARLYTFPVQHQAQGSLDFFVGTGTTLLPGLTLEASQFERFVAGKVAIPDLGLARYNESNAAVTYRLPVSGEPPAFGVGAVRTRVARTWQNGYTYLRGDVLFRVKMLPSLVGPSIGYQFSPDGKANHWLITLVTLPK